MAAQTGEVFGRKELGIADLDGVAKIAGQRGQKRVQFLEKRAHIGVALPGEAAKLENQRGDARPIRRQHIQKRSLKQRGVQERGVVVARPGAVTRMARELLYGDVFGRFEGELQRGGRRSEQLAPVSSRMEIDRRRNRRRRSGMFRRIRSGIHR